MRNNLPKFNNLKALLVEDNPINIKMMKYTLKSVGIDCDIAQNGQIGFDMRKKNSYDVIFMDIQMPIMNGIEATKAIIKYEKDNNLEHIPIIAVTANAMNENREKFLSEGMDEFIPKPIDLKLFFNILDKFFKKDRVDSSKTILIYKKTTVEAKIIGAMVEKLGYRVKIANGIDDFQDLLNSKSYHSILLDRVEHDSKHRDITKILKDIDTPTLLFIERGTEITNSDRDIYSDITYKLTSFDEIQNKILNLQKRL